MYFWNRKGQIYFMDNTMLIQIINQKAFELLHELEELHLIKVLKIILYLLNQNSQINTKA